MCVVDGSEQGVFSLWCEKIINERTNLTKHTIVKLCTYICGSKTLYQGSVGVYPGVYSVWKRYEIIATL